MSYAQRVEILQKRGVPAAFIKDIARKKPATFYWGYFLALWVVICIFSVPPLDRFYSGIIRGICTFALGKSDLFIPSPGPAMLAVALLALFVISLPWWACLAYFLRPTRDGFLNDRLLYKGAVILRTLASGEDMSSVHFNAKFPAMSNLTSADAFMSAVGGGNAEASRPARDRNRRQLAAAIFAQVIVTLFAVGWMHFSYANISGDTIEFSGLLSDVKLPLSQVTSVTTACVYVSVRGGKGYHQSRYTLASNDGATDLFHAQKPDWSQDFSVIVNKIEGYDLYLRSRGVHMTKISADEARKCVAELSEGRPEQRAPLYSLLTER